MDQFVTFAAGAAMVMSVLSFIKLLRGGKTGDALTILVLFGVGVAVAFLASETSYTDSFGLANATAADKVFVGFALSAGARVLYEATNDKPNNEPKLFANPPASE